MHNRFRFAIAVVVVAGLAAIALLRRPAPPPQASVQPAVALATVRYGSYAVAVDATGTVGAPGGATAQLAFSNPGVLRTLYVRVGERVVAGEPLAALDTRALSLDAVQARAQARAAAAGYDRGGVPQAALDAARDRVRAAFERAEADRAEAARAAMLYGAGVNSLKDLQMARAQLAADQAAATGAQADLRAAQPQGQIVSAQLRAAQARAQSAELLVNQGTLYAPTDGIVTAIFRRPGEVTDPSTPVVAIGAPQNEVTLRVSATAASQIAVDNPALIRLTGSQGDALGHVSAIVPAVDPVTQSATVVVSATPPGAVTGAAVSVRITVARVHGLLVPQSSIVEDPQNGQDTVFVLQRRPDGSTTFAQRIVRIAHEDGATADLASGVRPGERVAAQGAFELLAPAD